MAIDVVRDRDRHLEVELELSPGARLSDAALAAVGRDLNVESFRTRATATGCEFEATLRESFARSWPSVELYELFLQRFRVRLRVRVDPPSVRGQYPEIEVLDSATAVVRRRPEMYVGDVRSAMPLFDLAVGASVDRFLAGTATRIDVAIDASGSISVTDDAPGTPLADERGGRVHEDIRFSYGLTFVNALSLSFRAESARGGNVEVAEYERGQSVDPAPSRWRVTDGNRVTFRPDLDLIDANVDASAARATVEWRAMLARGATLTFNGEQFANATPASALRRIAGQPLWDNAVFDFSLREPEWTLSCVLGFRDGAADVRSHVNLVPVDRGSSAELGLRRALEQAITLGKAQVAEPLACVAAVLDLRQKRDWHGPKREHPDVEDAIARRFVEPLSVFLDSIPGARGKLLGSDAAP